VNDLLRRAINEFLQGCEVKNCRRDGCAASLGNVPNPHWIADMDKPSLGLQNRKHCDFVIFHDEQDGVHAIALELKNSPNVGRAVDQLRETARYLQERFPAPHQLSEFRAVLVHGRGISKAFNRKLLRAKLIFRGAQVTIERRHCNDPKTPIFA